MEKITLADLPDGALIQISNKEGAWAAMVSTPDGIYIGGGSSPDETLGNMERFDPNGPGCVPQALVAAVLTIESKLALERIQAEIRASEAEPC